MQAIVNGPWISTTVLLCTVSLLGYVRAETGREEEPRHNEDGLRACLPGLLQAATPHVC